MVYNKKSMKYNFMYVNVQQGNIRMCIKKVSKTLK